MQKSQVKPVPYEPEYRHSRCNTSANSAILNLMKERKHLILLGMKHSGKSTVGRELASQTGRLFFDTDDEIRALTGKTARHIWDEGGQTLFAQKETEACAHILEAYSNDARTENGLVIATGGGIADNPEALQLLGSRGTLIYLDVSFSTLFSRILHSAERDGRLPGFLQGGDPKELFTKLSARRSQIYVTIADIRISAEGKTPSEISHTIMELVLHEQ
ncbi:MAG: Shikimate kinase 1 [Spirochaetes bacterium ADurb.Bin269]|nr:MAG: Shikimate kinase 1 [Spirochaetes bacterium ADurb.Bin269]